MVDPRPQFINQQLAAIAAAYGLAPAQADLLKSDAFASLLAQALPLLNTSNALRTRFTAIDTALAADDSEILVDTNAGDRVVTLPLSSSLPAGSRAYIVANVSGNNRVLIRTTAPETFTNGLTEMILLPGFDLRLIGVGAPTPQWALGSTSFNSLQVRRNAAWGAASFVAPTPVPFDALDFSANQQVIGSDIGGASPELITFGATGLYTLSYWFTVDSTGGLAWSVDAELQIGGVAVPGGATTTRAAAGRGQAAAIGPILVQATAGQVARVVLTNTALTGSLTSLTMSAQAAIN